jgi:DNA primase
MDLLPDTPERAALVRLHDLVSANHEASSYAGLREQLRGLPEEALIESAATELLGQPFDEGEAEGEFKDTLERCRKAAKSAPLPNCRSKPNNLALPG